MNMTSKSNSSNDKMYSREETPLNNSWEDWSAEWWKWVLSIPDKDNPIHDRTGEIHTAQRYKQNVFFLAGTHDRRAERTCQIPEGVSILFPIATMSASYAEFPNLRTESELRNYAEEGNQVSDMKLTIDGEQIDKGRLQGYRVKSPLFKVKLPENNIHLYADGGETEVVSDGYWAFLKPLSKGKHTLIISQTTKDHPASGTLNCRYDLTYHLEIQ